MDLREVRWGMGWIYLAEDRDIHIPVDVCSIIDRFGDA
jgi:hypothetical protein